MSDTTVHGEVSRSSDCPPAAAAPVAERLEARRATIGAGMEIRRALPNRHRRMIGAWCFLDHAGPADFSKGQGLNIGPHPHIGLQTFTWLIEGTLLHRDSLGCQQLIHPGQVNLMTAGRGISHAEESPVDRPGRIHAAQLWIALPAADRHCAPDFRHYPNLPVQNRGAIRVTVLAGGFDGESSPAKVFSPLVGLDIAATRASRTELLLDPTFEYGALTLEGQPVVAGQTLPAGTLLYLGCGRRSLELETPGPSRLLLIGGVPFGEEILLWWNFVARTAEEMETATRDWVEGVRFGHVDGARGAPLSAPDLKGLRPRESPR